MAHLLGVVVPMVHLQAGHPRGRHGLDDRVVHDAPALARERVRHDRDAAGLPHETHRPHRIGRVVRGVVGDPSYR